MSICKLIEKKTTTKQTVNRWPILLILSIYEAAHFEHSSHLLGLAHKEMPVKAIGNTNSPTTTLLNARSDRKYNTNQYCYEELDI